MGRLGEAILKQLRDISSERDPHRFLRDLRDLLAEPSLDWIALSEELSETQLGSIYCVSALLNDVWSNIAIDASFPFPAKHELLKAFSANLREATLEAVRQPTSPTLRFTECLFKAIQSFFLLLREIQPSCDEICKEEVRNESHYRR
jgi:hypothetical protein